MNEHLLAEHHRNVDVTVFDLTKKVKKLKDDLERIITQGIPLSL